MKELKIGERFIIPDGDDGHLIEVQERGRHSLCDGCFFNDFTCMNRGFGYCDFERRSDHKNVIFKKVKRMAARYNFRKTILRRLEICWNVLTHKTFIAYTTDDIGDKWSLINNIESLEQFGQWLVSGGYKENSNYKK